MIQVAARTSGVVREVLAQEGDDVTKGQVLARLEDDEPRLQAESAAADMRQAEAQIPVLQVQLTTAKRELSRLQGLVATNFVAGQRIDQAQDAVRQVQAGIEAQQAAIGASQGEVQPGPLQPGADDHPGAGRRPHRAPLRQPRRRAPRH